MKVLYLDCFSGISGDMFIGALLDAGLSFNKLNEELVKLNLKNVNISKKRVKYNGISATKFIVNDKERGHIHRNFNDMVQIIEKSKIDNYIKEKSIIMLKKLYLAEKKIHRNFHHFHELGRLDTIIDIVGALTGIRDLEIERIFSSKVNVGTGFVKTAHGIMPVPAPATAEIIKGIPVYSNQIDGELVTPTGGVLLTTLVDDYKFPVLKIKKVGYGAGTRKYDSFPNLLRVYVGETDNTDKKILIQTNIDDMNPELYENVMEKLFKAGAVDVFMQPVYMKKNRPGIILSCMCSEKDKEKILRIIFQETTTIGVRIFSPEIIELEREIKRLRTRYGIVKIKVAKYNSDIINITPEYDDCKKKSKEYNVPLKKVYQSIYEKIKFSEY